MECTTLDNDKKKIVQIDLEDIQVEISFWESVVLCYILGANSPQNVMKGFVRRIWGKYGVDKVSLVGRGFFWSGSPLWKIFIRSSMVASIYLMGNL